MLSGLILMLNNKGLTRMKLPIPYQAKTKEEYVHSIFSDIAWKYDWMNTFMTFNRDKYWRRFAVEKSGLQEGGLGLDICCGTGKLSLEQAKKVGSGGRVIGLDFCENMLQVARKNLNKEPIGSRIELIQGNAMDLPFADNTFDCATIGFALRNVPDITKTLQEMMRVVKPGGKVVSLELSKPSAPLFRRMYWLYFEKLIPLLGKLRVGVDGPYAYLPYSVKIFPHQEEIRKLFSQIGLLHAACYELTGGIVAVHLGTKP